VRKYKISVEIPTSRSADSLPMVGASLEAIYLTHFLQTLTKLQDTFWKKDAEVYSLFIEYLRNAVLDEDVCEEINDKMARMNADLITKGTSEEMIKFYLGFLVVKEVMKYLNNALDLTHEDIIGKAYDFEKISLEATPDAPAKAETPN